VKIWSTFWRLQFRKMMNFEVNENIITFRKINNPPTASTDTELMM
jgi:hypothetical protein